MDVVGEMSSEINGNESFDLTNMLECWKKIWEECLVAVGFRSEEFEGCGVRPTGEVNIQPDVEGGGGRLQDYQCADAWE